jgi:RNA polymerase sporulation-specific sigma factor
MVVFARKSWENIENCKSISWDVGVSPEKFVKNRQSFAGIILRCREIMGLCYFMFLGRNTMQGKVEICGVNTARLKTLTAAQMDELMIRAKAGDAYARQQLIEGNLRLVLSVIQRFDKRGESPDDLFQVGCIGLMKAINNFDPTKQVRFSTYGVPMIAGEVRRYLRDNSAIWVSRSIRDVAYRVLQCKEAMTPELGREPTVEELAKQLELTEAEVSEALDAVCAPVSLFDPVYTDGGDPLTVMDQVRDTKNTENNWLEKIALRTAYGKLGEREKQILSLRFIGGKTQMEVASTVGISQAQVSRLEKGALSAMRKDMTS